MLETWQDRLEAEHKETADRLVKLNRFLADDQNLHLLSRQDVGLLVAQSYAMTQYVDILRTRLLRAERNVG